MKLEIGLKLVSVQTGTGVGVRISALIGTHKPGADIVLHASNVARGSGVSVGSIVGTGICVGAFIPATAVRKSSRVIPLGVVT